MPFWNRAPPPLHVPHHQAVRVFNEMEDLSEMIRKIEGHVKHLQETENSLWECETATNYLGDQVSALQDVAQGKA